MFSHYGDIYSNPIGGLRMHGVAQANMWDTQKWSKIWYIFIETGEGSFLNKIIHKYDTSDQFDFLAGNLLWEFLEEPPTSQ